MEFINKTVRSRPGLTQEQALASLQESSLFRPGTRIASIKPRGDRWSAELLIPKTAEFPPSDDESSEESAPPSGDSEGGESDSESSSDSSSESPAGPPSPGEEKKPPGKGGADQEIVHLLSEILHALQGGGPTGGMGGPDDLGPGAGGPPAPPPHGGPAGGPGAPKGMGAGRPMKPGEVPNKPGVNPIGAPAFASTRQANPMGLGQPTPGGLPAPGAAPVGGALGDPAMGAPVGAPCPTCGGPAGPDGSCPACNGGAPMGGPTPGAPMTPLASRIASLAGKVPTITVSASENMSIKEAKAELEAAAAPFGYKVKQIKRVDGRPRALLSVR